jgi:hypothetical protein
MEKNQLNSTGAALVEFNSTAWILIQMPWPPMGDIHISRTSLQENTSPMLISSCEIPVLYKVAV